MREATSNIIITMFIVVLTIIVVMGLSRFADYIERTNSYKVIKWDDETQVCIIEKQSGSLDIKEYCIKK